MLHQGERRAVPNERIHFHPVQLEQWKKAVRKCDDALELDSTSTKAHFRRAQAQLALKNLDEALVSAQRAADLDPTDAAIKALVAKCNGTHSPCPL